MIIAQISDIHAAADNDHLVRFARALTWLDNLQPDALVISGDLIDDQWFAGYHRITEQLNARLYPTYILPGNSDNPEQMGLILGERFRAGNRTASAGHFVAQVGNLRLIGLDTTIAATSAGEVGPHLHWLSENLTAEPGASLLFLHHHVIPSGIPAMDNIMCQDNAELEMLLNHHPQPPLAIATGHVHRPVMGHFAGIPCYISGSICPANPLWFGGENIPPMNEPPCLMVHHLCDGSLVSHHVAV